MTSSTGQQPPYRRRLGFEQVARMASAALINIHDAGPKRPLRVLEAGVGNGQLLAHLLNNREICGDRLRPVELWGFDIADITPAVKRLEQLHPKTPWSQRIRQSSSDRWPFDDAYFDLVLSNQVIEHVADLPKFLSECRRVLRQGGLGIHVFPTQRMVIESHIFVPFVHWLDSDWARLAFLRALYGARLNKGGWKSRRSAVADVRYLRLRTHYRTLDEVIRDAECAGLFCVPRRSLGYLSGAFRLGTGKMTIGPRHHSFRDRISAAVAQRLFSVTLVMWPKDATGGSDSSSEAFVE